MDSNKDNLECNRQGKLSDKQWDFLSGWMMLWIIFGATTCGVGTYYTIQERSFVSTFVLIFVGSVFLHGVYSHYVDLWLKPTPERAIGIIYKYKVAIGMRYFIYVDTLRLGADTKLYHELENRMRYEVYYSARTRWLLSFQPVGEIVPPPKITT